jgi:hypothetical protein
MYIYIYILGHWRTRHAGVRALGVGIELSLELLALLHACHMQSAVNSMIILLADFSGIRIQVQLFHILRIVFCMLFACFVTRMSYKVSSKFYDHVS